jgi:hypothetical protein
MILNDSTFRIIKANDVETTLQQHMMTNVMENVQSGKLFIFLYLSLLKTLYPYTRTIIKHLKSTSESQ